MEVLLPDELGTQVEERATVVWVLPGAEPQACTAGTSRSATLVASTPPVEGALGDLRGSQEQMALVVSFFLSLSSGILGFQDALIVYHYLPCLACWI